MPVPFYFICIHNEPYNIHGGYKRISRDFEILNNMVEMADARKLRFTLMFTAQWADYISDSPERMKLLRQWIESGHEIAAHHHNIFHINWDGYTDFDRNTVNIIRTTIKRKDEYYRGNFSEYTRKLKILNPEIKSGCMNDEIDKNELPDSIIYDTSLGTANFKPENRLLSDFENPDKGINEFISVAIVNNIKRKWLAHYQINNKHDAEQAIKTYSGLKSGAYGVVMHSFIKQMPSFIEYIDFLHFRDIPGQYCKTISEIIEDGLIPEKEVNLQLIKELSNKLNNNSEFVC